LDADSGVKGPDAARVILVETITHGRVLVREAAGQPAAGLLFGFHGYGENAEIQLQRLGRIPASRAWMLASVQGLNRFYRGRTEDTIAAWMTRQDRDQVIADNIRYVDAVVEELRHDDGKSSSAPIVCAGFSQGVAMAFRAAVRGRAGCAGVIAVGGDVPPELLVDRNSRFPPVLLMRGERDEWYTQDKAEKDLAALRRRGVSVHPMVFDGAHEWTDAVNDEIARFLRSLETDSLSA
jgi:predicted esterase